MNTIQVQPWEKKRRWGIGVYCIPRVLGVFLVITLFDYFVVGRDWVRLVGELRGNLLVAAVAGVVFGIIGWRENEKRYREYLRARIEAGEQIEF
ncbi:MAG: hypothetical protein ABIF77_07865 [bacterium]